MPMQLSFCKMYNKNSDQLLNLFFDDKGKHTKSLIILQKLYRFTTDDFQSTSLSIEQLELEVAIMNH